MSLHSYVKIYKDIKAMKWIPNLFYTIWSKILIVLLVMFFMLQTGICFADTTVMLRENPIAVRNVLAQWDSYDYKTSEFLKAEIERAIDSVLQYSLYYRRDTLSENQTIVNADDNYREITQLLSGYENFTFALVNHNTNRIISNIPKINYKDSSAKIRKYFPENSDSLLIVRDARTPYYENGTMTDYNQYIAELAENYDDNFDLYMYFGEDFSFISHAESFRQTHLSTLSRVRARTTLAFVYIAIAAVLFAFLLAVTGRHEPGGKIYPGISDTLANDTKLALFLVVIISMAALYENSLYMALRADTVDFVFTFSSDFYIFRSYVALLVNSCIIMAACCTIKRQHKLGTLFTNTYIYKFFFAYKRNTDK
jgi:hypothetical protein